MINNKHIFFISILLLSLNLLLYSVNRQYVHSVICYEDSFRASFNTKIDNLSTETKKCSEWQINDCRISNIEADLEELKLQYRLWDEEWKRLLMD